MPETFTRYARRMARMLSHGRLTLAQAADEIRPLTVPSEPFTMRLVDVLTGYRDGDETGWDEEFRLLRAVHPDRITGLTASIQNHGIRTPILLGTDGRVWDGHHRLAVAAALRLDEVPVIKAAPGSDPDADGW